MKGEGCRVLGVGCWVLGVGCFVYIGIGIIIGVASQNISWYLVMFISSDPQLTISRYPGKFGKKCISSVVRIH